MFSEIGKLERVLLHKPGKEVENLTPDTLGRLLFDDIPFLKIAAKEHDYFASILKENGAEVLYLEDLIASVFKDEKIKDEFILDLLEESNIHSHTLKEALFDYLKSKETEEMIEKVCSGVRKQEIKYKSSSLSDIIKDEYEFFLDPMPNLYFTRDPGACIGNGLAIHTMKTVTRRRETLFLKYVHKYHPVFELGKTRLWYDRTFPYPIEGGDIHVFSDKLVVIGCSERTSAEAIELIAKNIFEHNAGFEKILCFEIQKKRAYMHLDTVLTMIDYDKFTVHPGIEQDLNVYEITKGAKDTLNLRYVDESLSELLKKSLGVDSVELIRCGGGDAIISSREQWNDGSNTLAIAPGVVITYERNYVSNELLEKRGLKVITMPSSELSRGRGGPRCMSMTMARAKI